MGYFQRQQAYGRKLVGGVGMSSYGRMSEKPTIEQQNTLDICEQMR